MSHTISCTASAPPNRRQFLSASALAACSLWLPRKAAAVDAPAPGNVFLVTIDTLRADHLPMYGYPRNTSPFLQQLAGKSTLFGNAVCTCSHTNPAHLSLLSGLQPPQHKLHTNVEESFSEDIRMLSQHFQEKGYATAACCSVRWLKVMDRGFDHFVYFEREQTPEDKGSPSFPAEATMDHAEAWLREQSPEKPFFLWVHLFDPHRPLHAPEAHTAAMAVADDERKRLLTHWREGQGKSLEVWNGDESAMVLEHEAYDAEIHYTDAQIGRLYQFAQDNGFNRNAQWIITADHGEGMGSHRYRDHGMYIYQEELRVPLIMHDTADAFAPRRVEELVSHVDILPTLREMHHFAAAEGPAAVTGGASLLPILRGETNGLPFRFCFAQRQHRYPKGYSLDWEPDPVYALMNSRYKYIVHAETDHEFYDLVEDPLELRNRAKENTPLSRQWEQLARGAFDTLAGSAAKIGKPKFTNEYEDVLKSAGYL